MWECLSCSCDVNKKHFLAHLSVRILLNKHALRHCWTAFNLGSVNTKVQSLINYFSATVLSGLVCSREIYLQCTFSSYPVFVYSWHSFPLRLTKTWQLSRWGATGCTEGRIQIPLLPYFLITWRLNIQAKISYRNYVKQSKLIVLFVAFCSVFLYEHVLASLRQTTTAVTLNNISLLHFVADKTEAKPVYKSERSAINQVEVNFFFTLECSQAGYLNMKISNRQHDRLTF